MLRGIQPIIICPSRSIEGMKIPTIYRQPLNSGRLLMLSFFDASQRRSTTILSETRNLFVAALADQVYFAHIAPKSKTAQLARRIQLWGLPIS